MPKQLLSQLLCSNLSRPLPHPRKLLPMSTLALCLLWTGAKKRLFLCTSYIYIFLMKQNMIVDGAGRATSPTRDWSR
jgi:hypothetical protein